MKAFILVLFVFLVGCDPPSSGSDASQVAAWRTRMVMRDCLSDNGIPTASADGKTISCVLK